MKIFISYRRDDSSYATTAIFDQLTRHFGSASVFMDVTSIPVGVDFNNYLTSWIHACDVVLVVIGERWLGVKQDTNTRRLDDPRDFVRVEIEAALDAGIPLVPVLVGAQMPRPSDLPESLRALTYRNAVFIDAGRDFASHIAQLILALERLGNRPKETRAEVLTHPIKTEGSVPPAPVLLPDVGGDSEDRGGIFISYRREGAAETARLVRYELMARHWNVFLDVEDLGAGAFDEKLLQEIAARKNFILILATDSLERCHDERDWLRREIVHAIETERNIVPFLKEGCPRPHSQSLVTAIAKLSTVNCVNYSHEYYEASISKLISFLKSE